MDYKTEKMESFKVIGFVREFCMDLSYKGIPLFWNEVFEKYEKGLFNGKKPENSIEQAICDNKIGEFGVCFDNIGTSGKFHYMIAGRYMGGEVPSGMEVREIPSGEWAKFNCIGPMPGSLQSVNTAIFNEWLPTNGKYEIAAGVNIEWYSPDGSPSDADYKSAIWLPVKEK